MIVYIDEIVYNVLDEFYDASMRKHPSLDYQTVIAKIDRLEKALYDFADYAEMFHGGPYRRDWREAGYNQYNVEGFNFAYRVYVLPTGEKLLYYHDAVHDSLNCNPEDK